MTELAPWNSIGSERGTIEQKPWEYQVTVNIPHLMTPEALGWVIKLLQAQTIKPYIHVVDTGSTPEVCKQLEALRDDDVEIHYIRGHAYLHKSFVIAAALDLSMALCQSEYLFFTQTDVFMQHRGVLKLFVSQCNEQRPVVGYEISPRWNDRWHGMVGHTATIVHMPTMRDIGATWNMLRGEESYDLPMDLGDFTHGGWPDTETTFNEVLREHHIRNHFVGHDTNGGNYIDEHIRHCRSYGAVTVYNRPIIPDAPDQTADPVLATDAQLRGFGVKVHNLFDHDRQAWVRGAIMEADKHLKEWQHEPGNAT